MQLFEILIEILPVGTWLSPLAGEGGEPAQAGEPGEGFFLAHGPPHPDARFTRVHPLPLGERVTEHAAQVGVRNTNS